MKVALEATDLQGIILLLKIISSKSDFFCATFLESKNR